MAPATFRKDIMMASRMKLGFFGLTDMGMPRAGCVNMLEAYFSGNIYLTSQNRDARPLVFSTRVGVS